MKPMENSRVLIVEDEPALREFLRLIIEHTGAAVVAVETADEGIFLLDRTHWTAVITDVRTPGRADGWDLARAVREKCPDTVIVVCSGDNARFDSDLPQDVTFIKKPWTADEMVSTLLRKFNDPR